VAAGSPRGGSRSRGTGTSDVARRPRPGVPAAISDRPGTSRWECSRRGYCRAWSPAVRRSSPAPAPRGLAASLPAVALGEASRRAWSGARGPAGIRVGRCDGNESVCTVSRGSGAGRHEINGESQQNFSHGEGRVGTRNRGAHKPPGWEARRNILLYSCSPRGLQSVRAGAAERGTSAHLHTICVHCRRSPLWWATLPPPSITPANLVWVRTIRSAACSGGCPPHTHGHS
jgi:hypothetical protein